MSCFSPYCITRGHDTRMKGGGEKTSAFITGGNTRKDNEEWRREGCRERLCAVEDEEWERCKKVPKYTTRVLCRYRPRIFTYTDHLSPTHSCTHSPTRHKLYLPTHYTHSLSHLPPLHNIIRLTHHLLFYYVLHSPLYIDLYI